MKKTVFFTILFVIVAMTNVCSQIGVTSYSTHALGINTSKEKKFSGELKSFFNREIESTIFELSGFYNFKSREFYQFSAGLGLDVAPFYEYDRFINLSIPVQLNISPLSNFKELSFVIELAPEWYPEDGLNIRHLWGIRYTFKK